MLVRPSVHQSIRQSISQSIRLSVSPSVCHSVHQSAPQFVSPSVRPSDSQWVSHSVCASLSPSVRSSVIPSDCPSVRSTLSRTVHLSVSLRQYNKLANSLNQTSSPEWRRQRHDSSTSRWLSWWTKKCRPPPSFDVIKLFFLSLLTLGRNKLERLLLERFLGYPN